MIVSSRCHDCGVEPGQLHTPGCDVEVCSHCGEQAIGCPVLIVPARLPWTGDFWAYRRCAVNGPAWWDSERREWVPGRWWAHSSALGALGFAVFVASFLFVLARVVEPWGPW